MEIKITKLTDVSLLRRVNAATTGKESRQTLRSAYRLRHSTIRTQIFLVECRDIPQFVSYHLRTHFTLHAMPPYEYGWMFSKRPDRGGEDFREVCDEIAHDVEMAYDNDCFNVLREQTAIIRHLPEHFDRYAPTNFTFLISAEGLMTMTERRLCIGAVSKETREVAEAIVGEVRGVDPDLWSYLRRPCVLTGICREAKCCGFIDTANYKQQREDYKSLFSSKH